MDLIWLLSSTGFNFRMNRRQWIIQQPLVTLQHDNIRRQLVIFRFTVRNLKLLNLLNPSKIFSFHFINQNHFSRGLILYLFYYSVFLWNITMVVLLKTEHSFSWRHIRSRHFTSHHHYCAHSWKGIYRSIACWYLFFARCLA